MLSRTFPGVVRIIINTLFSVNIKTIVPRIVTGIVSQHLFYKKPINFSIVIIFSAATIKTFMT